MRRPPHTHTHTHTHTLLYRKPMPCLYIDVIGLNRAARVYRRGVRLFVSVVSPTTSPPITLVLRPIIYRVTVEIGGRIEGWTTVKGMERDRRPLFISICVAIGGLFCSIKFRFGWFTYGDFIASGTWYGSYMGYIERHPFLYFCRE